MPYLITENRDKICRTPLVSVLMITYGQELYIAQAIESVIMQQTSFEFELLIAEDCSPDGTRALIQQYQEKYPDRIRLFCARKNVGMSRNFRNGLHNCRGKYIAICEGDDFWIDSQKLQKQADYMEQHPDCTLTFGNLEVLNQARNTRTRLKSAFFDEQNPYDSLMNGINAVATCTACGRTEQIREWEQICPEGRTKEWGMEDLPLWLFLAHSGKVHRFPDYVSCYRELPDSASHGSLEKRLRFVRASLKVRLWYLRQFGGSCNSIHYLQIYCRNSLTILLHYGISDPRRLQFFERMSKRFPFAASDRALERQIRRNIWLLRHCPALYGAIRHIWLKLKSWST